MGFQISYFLLNDSCWKIMFERNYILGERETNLKRILVFYLIAVFFLFQILTYNQCPQITIYVHVGIFDGYLFYVGGY